VRVLTRREALALVALLVFAFVLRMYKLDAQSLWNDEGTTVALAQRDVPTILENAANDIHPPLYYVILHYWVSVSGTAEAAVRGLSVLTGLLVVAGTWWLARRLLTEPLALLAGLFAAPSRCTTRRRPACTSWERSSR
jgi:mannosyltransferase